MVANTWYCLRARVSAVSRPKPLLAPVINITAFVFAMEYENTRRKAAA